MNFWNFVLSGTSGPTGRPVSLFTFALQFGSWPENIVAMKYVNIVIHLLNGILVFLLLNLLVEHYIRARFPRIPQVWLAMLGAIIWASHPIHTYTVLYLIQRMTLLSSTFVLMAVISYILADLYWSRSRTRSYVYQLLAFAIFPMLAVFSKESGALSYTYMGVVYFLIKHFKSYEQSASIPHTHVWLGIFIPSAVIIGYLLFGYGHWVLSYSERPFTLIERLLTQTRVLWDYLYGIIFAPPSQFSLLGNDTYRISKSLLEPITTFFAIIGWLLLGWLIILLKPRYNVAYLIAGFSLLWFLSGHLIESTTVALEIYFDHRNYLPSLGILFGLIMVIFLLLDRYRARMRMQILVYATIVGFYMAVTYSGISLWKNPILGASIAVAEHPKSERSHLFLIDQAEKFDDFRLLEDAYKKTEENLGFSGVAEITKMIFMCRHDLYFELHDDVFDYFERQRSHKWVVSLMIDFLGAHAEQTCPLANHEFVRELLEALEKNQYLGKAMHLVYYYLAVYWSRLNNDELFSMYFNKAFSDGHQYKSYLLIARHAFKRMNFQAGYFYLGKARAIVEDALFPNPKHLNTILEIGENAQKQRDSLLRDVAKQNLIGT